MKINTPFFQKEHVAGPVVSTLNDLVGAVPPTSGWMIELDKKGSEEGGKPYRIYISGDTLFVDKLKVSRLPYDRTFDETMLIRELFDSQRKFHNGIRTWTCC